MEPEPGEEVVRSGFAEYRGTGNGKLILTSRRVVFTHSRGLDFATADFLSGLLWTDTSWQVPLTELATVKGKAAIPFFWEFLELGATDGRELELRVLRAKRWARAVEATRSSP